MSTGLSRRFPPHPHRPPVGRRHRDGMALHGEPALRVLAGRFALRAGLIARAEVADQELLRHSARSPHSRGGVSD
jgi:hypothetical protein